MTKEIVKIDFKDVIVKFTTVTNNHYYKKFDAKHRVYADSDFGILSGEDKYEHLILSRYTTNIEVYKTRAMTDSPVNLERTAIERSHIVEEISGHYVIEATENRWFFNLFYWDTVYKVKQKVYDNGKIVHIA